MSRASPGRQRHHCRMHPSTTYTKIYLHAVLQDFWDKYQTRIMLGQASLANPEDEPAEIDADMRSFIDDMSGGLRGTMIGIKDRFGKARIRANKVSYPARKNKRANDLYGTGVLPATTYGAEAVGYSPSMIKQLRTMASDSTGRLPLPKGWSGTHLSEAQVDSCRIGVGWPPQACLRLLKEHGPTWRDRSGVQHSRGCV